ncbi:hypothetical protein DFA_07603 [Cavenderia fasciculata]|uniref:Cysteine dioxygenase n=1 Tax=Cavenderia fasciculata TaxID=261658 RepID=F4Q639_CACFS|nr:uncharacterized protein DFA_07603 [Cavenderia fasciculata]EGG16625.1 hypothetical protein DFA_07603 [Cavenderia fasciculata]|eukprot:XP_004355099.1 hypothetical protein DFA_07603 [Cavenderia fasciculata]
MKMSQPILDFDAKYFAFTKLDKSKIGFDLHLAQAIVGAALSQISNVNSPPSANPVPVENYIKDLECFVLSQGSIRLRIKANSSFRIYLNSEKIDTKGQKNIYVLEVSESQVLFRSRNDNNPETILAKTTNPKALLEKGNEINYWISIDRNNRSLKFGKGEAIENLTLLKYKSPENVKFLDDLKYVGTSLDVLSILKAKYYIDPVVVPTPPFVVHQEKITLEQIEEGFITTIGNLPKECQALYSVVAGPSIVLEKDVQDAIRASLKPGKALYNKLLEKKEVHHSKLDETYLRVTLGENYGYSPGKPFVLELWPAGHRSPIHKHADAFAVIKVLHNSIHCKYFSDLNPSIKLPFLEANFNQDQVTYLAPNIFQTHQLINITNDFTATIQCYRYASDDVQHYEYFDYLDDATQKLDRFTPNTDYTYKGLLEVLRSEGSLKPKTKPQSQA